MSVTSLIALLAITLLMPPQEPATSRDESRDQSAERLELMKNSVKIYEFQRGAGPLKLQPDPAFRLGRQGNGGILEGAIFLWKDDAGRPEVAAQVFLHRFKGRPDGEWQHEFSSLSTDRFIAMEGPNQRWVPGWAGVTFKPLPGAPKPAGSAAQRLRQMRALAEEFKAEDNFGDQGNYESLRLLTTPVARYGKAGVTPEDGALFAFVEGTDPEVFLFLEVRKGADGPEWQYACAPMSCWPLRVRHKGDLVWELPLRSTGDPSKPFYSRTYRP